MRRTCEGERDEGFERQIKVEKINRKLKMKCVSVNMISIWYRKQFSMGISYKCT